MRTFTPNVEEVIMPIMTLGYLTLDAMPADTIGAAHAAGFSSVGIRITGRRVKDPYQPVVGNAPLIRDLRARLDGTGMRLSNVSAYHFHPDVEFHHLVPVLETVAALGSDTVVASSYVPVDARFIDLFDRYCETAAALGIRVAVEFMRYSALRSVDDVLALASRLRSSNVGFLIDSLHLARSGGSPGDLARLDAERIYFAQICDAGEKHGLIGNDELIDEARNGRLAPGQGSLPLHAFLDALPEGTEIEYEVPQSKHRHLPLEERARLAARDFRTFLDGRPSKGRSPACVEL